MGLRPEQSSSRPTDKKVALVDALSERGLATVEVASFVTPEPVPQLAVAYEVLKGIQRKSGVRCRVHVPNLVGAR